MRNLRLLAFVLACLSAPAFAEVVNVGDWPCEGVERAPPEPSGSDDAKCDSIATYYGIGRRRDFVAARACAQAERATHEFFGIDGPGVLMMVYANGEGVPRDLDRARAYACELGWEGLEDRLGRLDEMARQTHPEPIGVCDHAVGAQTIACTALSTDRQAAELDARYAALAHAWPPEQQRNLARLRKAATSYFNDVVYAQGGLPPAYPAAMAMLDASAREEALFERIVAIARAPVPSVPEQKATTADQELNEAYRALMRTLRDLDGKAQCGGSSVDATEIRDVQRLWIAYRDAWIAFGMTRHPQSAAAGWNEALTRERAQELRDVTEQVTCASRP
jgi:uncharacterized protein YecT (DUF1311 family)